MPCSKDTKEVGRGGEGDRPAPGQQCIHHADPVHQLQGRRFAAAPCCPHRPQAWPGAPQPAVAGQLPTIISRPLPQSVRLYMLSLPTEQLQPAALTGLESGSAPVCSLLDLV